MSEFEKRLFGDGHLPKPASIVRGDRHRQRVDTEAMTTDHDLKEALSRMENHLDERVQRIERALEASSSSYLRELEIRDSALHREMNLKEKSFRREQKTYAKALDDRLGRMEAAGETATKEIKDFKLWMGGIGVAVVLGIMGANATIFGGGKAFFDGGADSVRNQAKAEALIMESKSQTEANKALLKDIQHRQETTQPAVPPAAQIGS